MEESGEMTENTTEEETKQEEEPVSEPGRMKHGEKKRQGWCLKAAA